MPDTRIKILDAATHLFAEYGYEATSVRQIAEEVGVSNALVHHHFDSKSALLRAVFERVTRRVSEHRSLILNETADQPLRERIRALVADTFDLTRAHPEYVRLVFMSAHTGEAWDSAGLGELAWAALATNLGPTVQEYVDTFPDRGMMPVTHAVIGIFSACAGHALFAKWETPPPEGVDPEVWATRWRDRMTALWMRVLFPDDG